MATRAAELPQDFERLLYPDGALPLPRAYERITKLLSGAGSPYGFLYPFIRGDLTIKVFDRGLDRVFVLTPKHIKDYVSEYGSAELLFDRNVIADVHSGPLAEFDGMAPYVEGAEFERWQRALGRRLSPPLSARSERRDDAALERGAAAQQSPGRKPGRKPTYGWAAFEAEVCSVLDERGDVALLNNAEWKQADLERCMKDWCARTWKCEPGVTSIRDHVSLAMAAFRAKFPKAEN